MNHKIQTFNELFSSLPLSSHKIITIVGAGGKTTLLYALAEKLSEQNQKVLVTTTTHIKRPTLSSSQTGWILLEEENELLLPNIFSNQSVVCLGIPVDTQRKNDIPTGNMISKWRSPSLSFLKKVQSIPDYIICEGDGSRRMPVKIPRKNEPVLFPETDMVIGVIGLSCLGKPLEDTLFGWQAPDNLDFYHRLLSTTRGSEHRITGESLFMIATSSLGLLKSTANIPVHIIFNQADTLTTSQLDEIEKIARKIRDNVSPCHIVSLKPL